MVKIPRLLLAPVAAALIAWPLCAGKFQDTDPAETQPPPISVSKLRSVSPGEFGDFLSHTFCKQGERNSKSKVYPAQGVNTLGEVIDSAWFKDRHAKRRMTLEELARGPGNSKAPSKDRPWMVTSAKTEGITPGFQIKDSAGRKYILKLDLKQWPEMASAADVIGSKFFHALGYHVPENYIVTFDRAQLALPGNAGGSVNGSAKKRPWREKDIDTILARAYKSGDGQYRALASLYLDGEPLGPFSYHGVRSDDPNDKIPHEHRRELRGLYVIAAWLNHTDCKGGNTLDMVVEEGGVRYVKHHLIDFGATLGSASFETKSARQGHEYLLDAKPSAIQFFTFGFYVPKWARVEYSDLPSVGKIEAEAFEPDQWKGNFPNPAFLNRLPDDIFWATTRVMAFRDEDIRTIVTTGQYSDPKAVEWLVRTLIARRDKIVETFLEAVLPLDNFRVSGNRLEFDDLGKKQRQTPRTLSVQWSQFENGSGRTTALPAAAAFQIPNDLATAANGSYFSARIAEGNSPKAALVYLAKRRGRIEVVGIERKW